MIETALESHLAAVHEEVSDLGTDLREEIGGLRQEVRDGFVAVNSKLGGVENRIDNEVFVRDELESRVRRVIPNLPEKARS